ncbi:MAG: universal stress protein [Cyanobacteria bacterium P01_E01_bin.6]
MFTKILVALDRGDTCMVLFEKALSLAKATGASLMLLNVLSPDDKDSPAIPVYSEVTYYSPSINESVWEVYQERYREYEAKGLDMLRGFTNQAMNEGVKTEFTQSAGSPGTAICNLAKTWEADLVMVGSHGRKGLSEMILGSVSNYVMHHASCSVLVVHEQSKSVAPIESADLAAVEG